MTLEERLERLARRTPPGNPADILAVARARADADRPAGEGRFRVLVAAGVVVVVLLGAGALALSADDPDLVTAGPAAEPDEALPSLDSDVVPILPAWVPDGYRLAWVDIPAEVPSSPADAPLTERPYDYAFAYQANGAELEVQVIVDARIDDPQAVADGWNDRAAATTLNGRTAVGYTDDEGRSQLLVEVDGGVALVTGLPVGSASHDAVDPAGPSREVVDRFAGSLAAVGDDEWNAALASGADVASVFGTTDGHPVRIGEDWTLMSGETRVPRSVREPALWVAFGDRVESVVVRGPVIEVEQSYAVLSAYEGTRVAWGILPGEARTVTVTLGGSSYETETVRAAGSSAFAVEVTGSAAEQGTFRATSSDGALVASGQFILE